jgi:hypothetical protein
MSSGDVVDGNWYNSAGNQTNLWQYITASGNNTTYITVEDEMMGEAYSCRIRFSGVTDPESATGHRIEFTVRDDSGMGAVTFSAKLRDSDGTLRSTSPNFSAPAMGSFEKKGWTLSSSEANAISAGGYAGGLILELISEDGMSMGSNSRIGWASMQFPDAPSPDPPAATQNGSAFMLFLDI